MNDKLKKRIRPITEMLALSEPLLALKPGEVEADDVVHLWNLFKVVADRFGAPLKTWRPSLLAYAKTGSLDEKGSSYALADGIEVKAERRAKMTLVPDRLEALLERTGIDKREAFDMVYALNEKKVEALIIEGRLDAAEVAPCYVEKETFALKVGKSPTVAGMV